MEMELSKIFEFVKFTHKLQQVRRVIYVNGEDRDENDVEHSYQLALVAWYLVDSKGLDLDIEKVLKYAMAHDLVEVYAGDTFFYTTNQAEKDSKKARELEAAEKIKDEFPEASSLHEAIMGYESMDDDESKFVYALDKIMPVMNIYLDNGRTWKRENITIDMLLTKDEKVAVSEDVDKIWSELKKALNDDKVKLFNNV